MSSDSARSGGSVPLLYIHPRGHLNDLVVPAGALSCLNAVAVPKLGRFSFEVTDAEIRSARIIALDLHWALAIPGFEELVKHIRSIAPGASIIVGGITAGHYAREILARYPVDYVICGDSEKPFRQLVDALLREEPPPGIPNVHGRDLPPPALERMSAAEFDATDCLTADWFPTYERCSNWDAAAFPQGRTIPVARGCQKACPECYGSYASVFGPGYHLRSGQRLGHLVQQAQELGLRNLRLFVAKPPPRILSQLLRGLAARGPYRFSSAVGFYLCTAPSTDDLDLLEATFENPVAISLLPPEEHVPAAAHERLEDERTQWRRAARHIVRSQRLTLDAWTTRTSDLERVRAGFVDIPDPRVRVSYGAAWSVTRPTAGSVKPLGHVREAMRPVWTYYAGRLLSPVIDRLLCSYRYLDELDGDVDHLQCPQEQVRGFFDVAQTNWREHHLPYLPGLRFSVVPVHSELGAPPAQPASIVRLHGALSVSSSSPSFPGAGAAVRLEEHQDHRGVTLDCELEVGVGSRGLAFVPHRMPDGEVDETWVEQLSPHGLVVLRLPSFAGPARLEVIVRVQDVQVALLDAQDRPLVRGRADLSYFRRPRRRAARAGFRG